MANKTEKPLIELDKADKTNDTHDNNRQKLGEVAGLYQIIQKINFRDLDITSF